MGHSSTSNRLGQIGSVSSIKNWVSRRGWSLDNSDLAKSCQTCPSSYGPPSEDMEDEDGIQLNVFKTSTKHWENLYQLFIQYFFLYKCFEIFSNLLWSEFSVGSSFPPFHSRLSTNVSHLSEIWLKTTNTVTPPHGELIFRGHPWFLNTKINAF